MTFRFPEIYNFVPFWTIQPARAPHTVQIERWSDFIIKYAKGHNKSKIDLTKDMETPLFKNSQINRQLSVEDARYFIDCLVKQQNAKWLNAEKTMAQIITRKPSEWGEYIHLWARNQNILGRTYIYDEILNGDETNGQPFHNMDIDLFEEAMKYLEGKHKVQIVRTPENPLQSGLAFI